MRLLAHVTTVSLIALALGGCKDKQLPTSIPVGDRLNAPIPLPGGGTQLPKPIPRPPRPNATDFMDITAGDNHTCARRYNNTVFCWGIDNNGQAGSWTTQTCWSGQLCIDRPTILFVQTPEGGQGTLTATTIDAGSNHTCILDTLNDAYCWGDGGQGQVGFGAMGPMNPTKVLGGLKFNLISAGGQSTCASGAGGVHCWGIQGNSLVPTLISGYNYSVNLSVGALHSCIIDGTGAGVTSCWGNNQYGQLSLDPGATLNALFATVQTTFGPTRRLATQQSYTCAEQADGTVECAGENTWGQLGFGQTGTPASPGQPQIVGGGMQLHGVSAGPVHACALDASSMAWCWGNGFNGQVGSGASAVFSTPQAVTGGRAYRAIAAGGQHTCAIGVDNHIYCWGQNKHGQLGTQFNGGWVSNPVQALDPLP
jgi:alpha-tubulin suppressor-like RCC1 family protein